MESALTDPKVIYLKLRCACAGALGRKVGKLTVFWLCRGPVWRGFCGTVRRVWPEKSGETLSSVVNPTL